MVERTSSTCGRSSRGWKSLPSRMSLISSPANVPADCINLGQGFMNWSPPAWIREASHVTMDTDSMSNHYSHPRGRPRLLKALSKHYSPLFENLVKENRELGLDEIVVTAGANCGECWRSDRDRNNTDLRNARRHDGVFERRRRSHPYRTLL